MQIHYILRNYSLYQLFNFTPFGRKVIITISTAVDNITDAISFSNKKALGVSTLL